MKFSEAKIYRAAIERGAQAAAGETSADEALAASGLYPGWTAGRHYEGETYNALGQTWVCFAPYDNAVHPDIAPGGAAWQTFNKPLHGTTPETARPWVQPTGAHDMYLYGECAVWEETVYRCIALSGTAYSPEDYPGGWEIGG